MLSLGVAIRLQITDYRILSLSLDTTMVNICEIRKAMLQLEYE